MKYNNTTNNQVPIKNFTWVIKKMILIALGVGLASHLSLGISYDSGRTLLLLVLLFAFMNIVIKPFLILFALPFVVLTFGLGIWLINGVLFILVSKIVDGFHVESFVSALWGALIVSVVSMIANASFKSNSQRPLKTDARSEKNLYKSGDDFIDI